MRVKVWAAHGWNRAAHPQRVPERLLVEWPTGAVAPTDYWLVQLGDQAVGLRRLIKIARARWRAERDYRERKEELGLDHYEGRHWLGWHHHVTLLMQLMVVHENGAAPWAHPLICFWDVQPAGFMVSFSPWKSPI